MRPVMIWGLVLVGCIAAEGFTFAVRKDILTMEGFNNEAYTDYSAHKNDYTKTKGTITAIYDPSDREGLDRLNGTSEYLCTIEFETNDGNKVTDKYFPCDTDNDKVGGEAEIAYKLTPMVRGSHVDAARTEYVKSVKQLRKNTIIGAGFGIGIAAALGGLIISVKRK